MAGRNPPEKLDISFESPPVQIRGKYAGWKWEKLLAPVKAAPGCEARVRIWGKKPAANNEIHRIRKRLEEVAPLEKWKFRIHAWHGEDQGQHWAIYATYLGMMTKQEKFELDEKKRFRSEKTKKSWELRKARNELANLNMADITDLTRARRRSQ